MPTTTATIARAAAGFLAAGVLLLTGCTAGQSTEEACSAVNAELEDAQGELTSSISSLATDPDGAIEALETFHGRFAETVDGLDNAEIKKLGQDTEQALSDYITAVSDAAADPENADSETVTGAITDFQQQAQKFQDACTS